MRPFVLGLASVAIAAFAACSGSEAQAPEPAKTWEWDLPKSWPRPKVPADNPMSVDKVELGRHLFYDERLSGNGTQSCASCHRQELAFTDGLAQGVGSTGEVHPRGAMSLVNVAYASTLTWANPLQTSLEKQALVPMFGEAPVELGLAGKEAELLDRLRAVAKYRELFPRAFPGEADPLSLANVTKAIAAFERTIVSGRSPFDRYLYDKDPNAISESAKRGLVIFDSETTECFHCHGGFNFSDSVGHEATAFDETPFHNTGLYNLGGDGSYPGENTGVHSVTGDPDDMGKFRAPSLRNVATTAPYMHDGSIATLSEVIDHYAAGGRTITSGPNAGDGSKNPHKSPFVKGFTLTAQEKADLIAFLESLTDEALLTDPRFANPWAPGEDE